VAVDNGPIQTLLQEFAKLPGIGPKSAERIVHFLLSGDRRVAVGLRQALVRVLDQVKPCNECFNLTDYGVRCEICSDPRRDASLLCVVETPRDVTLFERTGSFRGLYHVLGGRLAPLDGITPDKLTLNQLADRVRRGGVREVILATSPTLEGDGTALFVSNLLANTNVSITKLARGLPTGSSLELTNSTILADAMDGRRAMQ
jgi:recombination protein RecR